LIIADPERVAGNVPPLPAAQREARILESLYATTALTRADATRRRFFEGAGDADVLDVAAHAVHDASDPGRTALLLAADGRDSGVVTARDLVTMHLRPGTTAMLTGCRTSSRIQRTDLDSLSSAFLIAGARTVVGSLWNVDDVHTSAFSIHVHRLMRSDTSPAAAVREAQLDMLRRGIAVRHWAAFQVNGAD
jgi:CHAT domain-containing protein